MLHTLQGSELKRLIDAGGYKYRVVADRAGLKGAHLSKILRKADVSTDELERIARAINIKPGDLLENSCGETRSILPLVEMLREFDTEAIPHVMTVLESLRALRACDPAGAINNSPIGPSNLVSSQASTAGDDSLEEVAMPLPRQGANSASMERHGQAAGTRRRHGSSTRSKTGSDKG